MNPVEIEYLYNTYWIGIITITLFLLAVLIIYLRDKRFKWLILALILAVFLLGGGIWLLFFAIKALNCWLLIAGEALVVTAIVVGYFTIKAKNNKNKIKKNRIADKKA